MTAPAASSALESKESLFSLIFGFDFFFFSSVALRGGDLAFSEGGFHTVIGITVNGYSMAAPKGLFAYTSGLEGGGELRTRGASARGDDAHSDSRAGEVGDPPNF